MDIKKKESERRILTRFLSNPSLKVKASAVRDLDPPDFSFDLFDDNVFKEVSVELTRVLNPALKQKEAAQDKIISLALDRFKKFTTDQVVVYVDFANQDIPFDIKTLENISLDLFDVVTKIAAGNSGYGFRVQSKKPLNRYIDQITVSNEEAFENWQSFGAFRVPYVDQLWFSEIITAKERKIKSYLRDFQQKWVILVSNFGHESSAFQFTMLENKFARSAFDRIFIYQYFRDEIIVIK